jgi:hypothetical protein
MNEKQGSVIKRAVVGKRGIQMVVIFGIQEATLESERVVVKLSALLVAKPISTMEKGLITSSLAIRNPCIEES